MHSSNLRHTYPITIWSHTNVKTATNLHFLCTRKAYLAFANFFPSWNLSLLMFILIPFQPYKMAVGSKYSLQFWYSLLMDPKNTNIPLSHIPQAKFLKNNNKPLFR